MVTTPLRVFGPLDQSHAGWAAAALSIGRPGVDLAIQGPDALPISSSNHSHEQNWLELLARPLWGLTAAQDAVPDDLWTSVAHTLGRALDPDDPWYVGDPGRGGQRVVESAAVGWAFALAPEKLWDPLEASAKDAVAAWLSSAYSAPVPDTNWHYFPVFAGHGLERLGIAHDRTIATRHLDRIGEMLLDDSVFEDGPGGRVDYYNPFAFHTYALLNFKLSGDDRFVKQAATFAERFGAWFAADGSAVPYGRSLAYRFAQGSLWSALAAADVEAVPWTEAAGFAQRHLDWWWKRPILDTEGRLAVGYGYPNGSAVEQYISAGSPWWATKIFTGLLAGADHPFWTAEASETQPGITPHASARSVHIRDAAGHVTRLNGQSWNRGLRHGQATYSKFAYSTLAAFSTQAVGPGLRSAVPDGALMLSEDGRHWRAREESDEGAIDDDGVLTVTWRPWPDVTISTTLEGSTDGWHTRTHVIETARLLHTGEGGWCVPESGHAVEIDGTRIVVVSDGLRSEMVDGTGARKLKLIKPMPGTHLYWPETVLPLLKGVLRPGRHTLTSRIYLGDDTRPTTSG